MRWLIPLLLIPALAWGDMPQVQSVLTTATAQGRFHNHDLPIADDVLPVEKHLPIHFDSAFHVVVDGGEGHPVHL